MKIKQISLENFRCFRQAKIDLSADIVAIYGRNGIGKTTIFDAVEFALLDSIGRFSLEKDPPDLSGYLPNLFFDDPLRVRIDFTGNPAGWIERTLGREDRAVSSIEGSGGWKNTNDLLFDFLLDEQYLPPRREVKSIAELFRATSLLSQDLIRHFIEGDTEERARILSCISGSAYLQRCLDKIKEVLKEAKKRKNTKEAELEAIQAKVREANQKITEREAQIRTIRERIGDEAAFYDLLPEILKEAGISVSDVLSQISEDEESLVAAIRGICQERFISLDSRSKLLAELEAIGQQHPARLEHRQRLKEMIDGARGDLYALLKKEEENVEDLKKADYQISEFEGVIIAQSKQYRTLKGLLESLQQKAELTRMKDSSSSENELIQRDLAGIKAKIKKDQTGLEEKRQEITRLQISVTRLSRIIDKLKDVKTSIPTYKNIKERIRQKDLQIQQSEEKCGALAKKIKELKEQILSYNSKVVKINQVVAAMEASSQEEADLIVRLRRYASNDECPMCGHVHSSPNALQDAISDRLKNVSTAFQEAVRQLQNETNELTRINFSINLCEQKFTEVDNTLQNARSEKEEAISITSKIEEDAVFAWTEAFAARLQGQGIPPISPLYQGVGKSGEEILTQAETDSGKTLEALISHSRTLLADHQINLQQAGDWVKETETRLNDDKSKADSLEEAHNRLQRTHQEILHKLTIIDRQIIESGLSKESQLTLDQISQLIEHARLSLVEQETQKSNQQIQRDKIQSELNSIYSKRMKLESNLKEWEQALGHLISEIEDFRFKAKSFGLPEDSSAEDIAQARIHLSHEKDKLDAVQKAAERYESAGKIKSLEKDRNEFYQQMKEARQAENENTGQIEKLQKAIEDVEKWTTALTEGVRQAVEAKINGYQMDINRLFRRMIPSPYFFEKISLRRRESGLELGLRYRDLKQDAGEPRFFLSSAQANILALSIFLSFAVRQQWSKLETILLDDPVQHLDDLDAVAFLDYLRAVALGNFGPRRQIIVSTCNQNLYLLMLRKFSLLESAGLHFMGISLLDDGKRGAQIHYDVGWPEGRYYAAGVG